MVSVNIMLNSIKDVKDFVNIVNQYDFDVELVLGKYVIDAKSIMGIFSLDLSQKLLLQADCEGNSKFMDEIAPFLSLIHI